MLAKQHGSHMLKAEYYVGNDFIKDLAHMEEYRKSIKKHDAVVLVKPQD